MPHSLFESLAAYQNTWFEKWPNPFQEDKKIVERFQTLFLKTDSPFSRDQFPGHLTGSCFLLDPSHGKILLLHHKKLEKWLQMGGHCDGECEMAQVALREAEEESGCKDLSLLLFDIIDLDIHLIPERKNEPEHFHYDVRYLGICHSPEKIQLAEEESNDLAWFPFDKAFQMAKEPSMHRVFRKVEFLQSKGLLSSHRAGCENLL